jgi:hypothetical protein
LGQNLNFRNSIDLRMHENGWGLTYTEMGTYNVFQLNRMAVDEDRVDLVFCFEGRIFDSRYQLTRAVLRNISPLELDFFAGHVANLMSPVDNIFEACGLFIKSHTDPSQEGLRSQCFDIMGYIGEHFGRAPGLVAVQSYLPSGPDMVTWRQSGSLPEYGALGWVLPQLQRLPVNTRRSINLLYEMCVSQFFDPGHASKINLDELGMHASPTAKAIYFHTANHRTLRRLRRLATTGSVDVTQIVAIFVGAAGEGGALSFFFVCSPHWQDASSISSIIQLMLSVARTQSFALFEPHVAVPFSEQVSLSSFVAPQHVDTFNNALEIPPRYVARVRIPEFSHHGIHNEFVRYLKSFYWPHQLPFE